MPDLSTPSHFIAGATVLGQGTIQAVNPVTREAFGGLYPIGGANEVKAALESASSAFTNEAWRSAANRAAFLEAVATQIEALGDILLETASAESGLPLARLTGERGRTCGQLRAFANHLRQTENRLTPFVDQADPARQPMPKPGLVRTLQPLGPIVVFGASNFPLAFSTAGGDTASAWAAGCPVVVKAHPSHPNTCHLVAQAINAAVDSCGLPGGVFSQIHGLVETGQLLVSHPLTAGVGFTGSKGAGLALWKLAYEREVPIPVFAEMGSVNPQIFLPAVLREKGSALAEGLYGSVTLGGGQFCTNPGLSIGIACPAWEEFLEALAEKVRTGSLCQTLNAGIAENYARLSSGIEATDSTVKIAEGPAAEPSRTTPLLWRTTGQELLKNPSLADEVFGPFHLAVTVSSLDELKTLLSRLEGQLTCSLFFAEADKEAVKQIAPIAATKAGRVIANGFPTGVEVSPAMQHGGPFPSTTDPRFTSVGLAAMERWLRPVSWQDFPVELMG